MTKYKIQIYRILKDSIYKSDLMKLISRVNELNWTKLSFKDMNELISPRISATKQRKAYEGPPLIQNSFEGFLYFFILLYSFFFFLSFFFFFFFFFCVVLCCVVLCCVVLCCVVLCCVVLCCFVCFVLLINKYSQTQEYDVLF